MKKNFWPRALRFILAMVFVFAAPQGVLTLFFDTRTPGFVALVLALSYGNALVARALIKPIYYDQKHFPFYIIVNLAICNAMYVQ